MTEDAIIDKIRACLALANDAGATPAEAEAAAVMANKLMLKYAISEAKIQMKRQKGDGPLPGYTRERVTLDRYQTWQRDLISWIAYANLCMLMSVKNRNGIYIYEVIGHETNVAATIQMLQWLTKSVHRMAQEAYKRDRPLNDKGYGLHMDPMRFHVAFKHGAGASLGDRLYQSRREAEQEAKAESQENANALMVIDDQVKRALVHYYPYLRRSYFPTAEEEAAIARRQEEARKREEEESKHPRKAPKERRPRYRKDPRDDMSDEAFRSGREAGRRIAIKPHTEIEG